MSKKPNLFNVKQAKIRLLPLSWFALFLTILVWFEHAPMMTAI